MNVVDKTVWQVAAGDTNRSYSDVLVQWDVIAMGPGRYGSWAENQQAYRKELSPRMFTVLERFCEGMKKGDLVILRLGTTHVLAIGEVADDELLWLHDFGDIDGWDLQHVRRVRWLWGDGKIAQVFDAYTMKWGDTVQPMGADAVKVVLERLGPHLADDARSRELRSLPTSERDRPLEMEEIAAYLFDRGMASGSIDALIDKMGELKQLAEWYGRAEEPVAEHETVAYLVLPLLRALGWTPQKMAVEWDRMDVALFDRVPRENAGLSAVVEAKKLNYSCLTAQAQAKGYAAKDGRGRCRRLVVTDGLRYGVFLRDKGQHFQDDLHAYLNLTRMMEEYPILKCSGAKEALWVMSADWDAAPRREPHEPGTTEAG